jgi:hypothetical protein
MNIKKLFFEAVKSRVIVALWIFTFVQTAVLTIIALVNTRAGLTIQTRCDLGAGVPDCTSAEAPWYYTLNFVAFALVAFILSTLVSLKLLHEKGRSLALAWLWLSAGVLMVATVLIVAILRIVEL